MSIVSGTAKVEGALRGLAHADRRAPAAGAAPSGLVLAIADRAERMRLAEQFQSLRWKVCGAGSGAELLATLERDPCSIAVLGAWLPDLHTADCIAEVAALHPAVTVIDTEGELLSGPDLRGGVRFALFHALGRATAPQGVTPATPGSASSTGFGPGTPDVAVTPKPVNFAAPVLPGDITAVPDVHAQVQTSEVEGGHPANVRASKMIPELIGSSPALQEVCRRIDLVAARRTPVLIYGPTGTGKELVARAVHRLSGRGERKSTESSAPGRFVAINCAALPEALIEAELFGYARGAFTGAVSARPGRIEAAAGGTVFLDEIGEMPLAVQSKLLRFLESGELQRIGESEPVRVDVRVVAATHRKLGAMAAAGTFRLDLLHRLAVFLIETPSLAGQTADLDALIAHRLQALAADPAPQGTAPGLRSLSPAARARLHAHSWPGNVRELEHTLERAWILAGDSLVIEEACIDFGASLL